MTDIVQTTGGICEMCSHKQKNHEHREGCDICECDRRA